MVEMAYGLPYTHEDHTTTVTRLEEYLNLMKGHQRGSMRKAMIRSGIIFDKSPYHS